MTDQAEMPKTLKLINTEQLRADAEILLKNYSTIRVRFVAESVLALLAEVERLAGLWCDSCLNTGYIDGDRLCSQCGLGRLRHQRNEARAEVEWFKAELRLGRAEEARRRTRLWPKEIKED